jgi:O-antigen/teichoic acid export membrane protein
MSVDAAGEGMHTTVPGAVASHVTVGAPPRRRYRGRVKDVPASEIDSRSSGRGFQIILIATALAGAAGYLIQGVAGWGLEPEEYAGFGVFWATFYLLVGAVAGIQQEIARTARPAPDSRTRGDHSRLLIFAGIAGGTVAALLAATAPLWGVFVFGEEWPAVLPALLVGTLAYVGFATLTGVLYGRMAWGMLAVLIIADPVIRLVMVGGARPLESTTLLDWAIVLPVPITLVLGLVLIAVTRASPTVVDDHVLAILRNAARTVVGSAAMAVLVSALPLFVAASARDESAGDVGALIFNLTLTRAPLVIPILAFQGWLVVAFRDGRAGWGRRVLLLLGAILLAGVALAIVAWFAVPPLVSWLFGDGYVLSPWLTAGIVLTASLTAALCASGAVVIARSGHTAFLVGWVLAAGIAILTLFLPLELGLRVLLALSIGPAVGLAVHGAFLVRSHRRRADQ